MIIGKLVDNIVRKIDAWAAEQKTAPVEEAPKAVATRNKPAARPRPSMPPKPEGLGAESERLLADIVDPCLESFLNAGFLTVVYELVRILDVWGTCPSVVQVLKSKDTDRELTKPLSLVSLREHSYRVTRIAVSIEKERDRYSAAPFLVPFIVVVGLGHDIGKIEEFRGKYAAQYTLANHTIVSAMMLDEIFRRCNRTMVPEIRDAVVEHHRGGRADSPLLPTLLKADAMAREEELKIHADRAYMNWEEWFVPKDLIARIEPEVNFTRGKTCAAFSYKSVVYVSPDLLYNKVRGIAKEKEAIDPQFLDMRNKREALMRIVKALRGQGMIPDRLPAAYYAMPFRVTTLKYYFSAFYTPMTIEAFQLPPSVMESRKIGWLRIITSVTAVPRRNTSSSPYRSDDTE